MKLSPRFKPLLIAFAVFNGLNGIRRIVESFNSQNLHKKDFIQMYIAAKSVLGDVNPYLPMPELAERWIGVWRYSDLSHPTPHTPFSGLLVSPLGFLSYEAAAVAWLLFELACFLATVVVLLRWWGGGFGAGAVVVAFFLLLGWPPVMQDLWYGQYSSSLLLLLTLAWLALREGKDATGGAILGLMVAMKLTAWPVILFLALARRWRSVAASGIVIVLANLAAMAVVGFEVVRDYYLRVGSLVAAMYRHWDTNLSSWTFGSRLFAGIRGNFFAPPLWASPGLARVMTFVIPAVVLLIGLWMARRARSFDTAFGVLAGVGILTTPIVWTHTLVFALIPMAVLARRLHEGGGDRKAVYFFLILAALLSVPQLAYASLAYWFTTGYVNGEIPIVPFAAGWISLIPIAGLLGILWMLWRSDSAALPAGRGTDSAALFAGRGADSIT
jgi:hypothetical protein